MQLKYNNSQQRNENKVYQIGTVSPDSAIGGRVIDIDGIAFTIMACTHGYGMGNIYDDRFINKDKTEI